MMQWYFLTPLDVLLFRESKPFSPSDGSWAKGLFPPMPITVFQAMRSLLPIRSKQDEKIQDIEFIGPFLVDEQGMPWMPTPKDLVLHLMQDESDRKQISSQPALVKRLSPAREDDPIWSDMFIFAVGVVSHGGGGIRETLGHPLSTDIREGITRLFRGEDAQPSRR